jgi:hypothetical protein
VSSTSLNLTSAPSSSFHTSGTLLLMFESYTRDGLCLQRKLTLAHGLSCSLFRGTGSADPPPRETIHSRRSCRAHMSDMDQTSSSSLPTLNSCSPCITITPVLVSMPHVGIFTMNTYLYIKFPSAVVGARACTSLALQASEVSYQPRAGWQSSRGTS